LWDGGDWRFERVLECIFCVPFSYLRFGSMVVLSVQFLCELCVQGYSSMQRHLIASRVRVHRECARTLFAAVDCATFNGYVVCIYKGCAFLCAWQDEVIQGQRASSKSKVSRVSALDFRFHSCIHSKAKPSSSRCLRCSCSSPSRSPFLWVQRRVRHCCLVAALPRSHRPSRLL